MGELCNKSKQYLCQQEKDFYRQCFVRTGNKLTELSFPCVMGILNVTPDSFYAQSRKQDEDAVLLRCRQIIEEGGSWIDIGGYSSRPGSDMPSADEELLRLCRAMDVLRSHFPDFPVSVDTARVVVAERMVKDYGVAMINDISGGSLDKALFYTVADLHVPYVLSHIQGVPGNMQDNPVYDDIMQEMSLYFEEKISELRSIGVNDIILDPGFGFGKLWEHNRTILRELDSLKNHGLPIMVGVSRKTMIYKTLGVSPEKALNGTTVAHVFALMRGVDFLRVHDVREAVECVRLTGEFGLGCNSQK